MTLSSDRKIDTQGLSATSGRMLEVREIVFAE